jgi:hypothetical protein
VADLRAEAQASDIELKNGSRSLTQHYSQRGEDFEDELIQMAQDYNVTDEQMRAMLLTNLIGPIIPVVSKERGSPLDNAVDKDTAMTGVQVTSLVGIVQAYNQGLLSREQAIGILVTSYPVDTATAESIVGQQLEPPQAPEPETQTEPEDETDEEQTS